MATLLYLVHRLPYPPNKGDKVRSWHLLRHLLQHHRVFLGTFVDEPADAIHVPYLRSLCAGVEAVPLAPSRAKVASAVGLLTGEPLTLRYYRSGRLRDWVREVVHRERPDAAIVFSSSMAPYAQAHPQLPMLVDFVDVDSAKWDDYAPQHPWPMSWVYAREGRRLAAYEAEVARQAQRAYFVTDKECALFRARAGDAAAARVEPLGNGVDAEHFSPDPATPSPYPRDVLPVVFTGAMDYWPNVDAVTWFAQAMLPALRERHPAVRFIIVGRSPTPAVQALAGEHVQVTGTVPDVRPWLQHAAVVVAPLRLARGIQNKILEAMAMGRPVVAAAECAGALQAEPGREFIAADRPEAFVEAVSALLDDRTAAESMGAAARARVLGTYSWAAHLWRLDAHLDALAVAPDALGPHPPPPQGVPA